MVLEMVLDVVIIFSLGTHGMVNRYINNHCYYPIVSRVLKAVITMGNGLKEITKQRIIHKSIELLQQQDNKELTSRELIYKLSQNGFNETFISSARLTNLFKYHVPEISYQRKRVNNGLRHTAVMVYKLK